MHLLISVGFFIFQNYIIQSTITCVTTMKRSSAETLDVLICGTERGQVHVVDSQAFSVVMTYKLQWIPSHLIALGELLIKKLKKRSHLRHL